MRAAAVAVYVAATHSFELSVVMPCLDEADTVGVCVQKARQALAQHGIVGEVIVADNGSVDGSQELAEQAGATVVRVPERGYGSALMGGITAASGRFVVMGDADNSYDWLELPRFVEKLREGWDVVQGCRFPQGGGRVQPGAMPPLHYWLGNPLFSLMARWWFGVPVRDAYCGMRGFRRDFQQSLGQRCTGMEFAVEMLLKAAVSGARIAEVPIVLHPDGREAHPPHLKTFRDGWRTLRLLFLYSPRWLFLIPGFALIVLGILGYAIALPGLRIGGIAFDAHTLLFASLALILGHQLLLSFLVTKTLAIAEGLLPEDPRLTRFVAGLRLEDGLLIGLGAGVAGAALLVAAVVQWWQAGFGALDYARTMRWVIPGAGLVTLGAQTAWSSFLVSLLAIQRRRA